MRERGAFGWPAWELSDECLVAGFLPLDSYGMVWYTIDKT